MRGAPTPTNGCLGMFRRRIIHQNRLARKRRPELKEKSYILSIEHLEKQIQPSDRFTGSRTWRQNGDHWTRSVRRDCRADRNLSQRVGNTRNIPLCQLVIKTRELGNNKIKLKKKEVSPSTSYDNKFLEANLSARFSETVYLDSE